MKKNTVLLYFPKQEPKQGKPRSPPLALLAIAAPLLKEGYDVKIFDALVNENAQKEILNNLDNAICLGATVWTGYSIVDSLDLAIKIKKIKPNFPIVWGSWHPSLFPSQTVEDSNVDIVVRGQGEVTFLEIVEHLEKNKPLKDVLGITYKLEGKVITNPDRPRIPLDELPPYTYNLVDVEKYMTKRFEELGERAIGYISSQGCPFNCAFCSDAKVYGRKRLDLSAERVLKDLKYLIETYNVTGFIFEDTNFFVNKERLLKICQGIINNNWDIRWEACGRVNQFLTFNKEELYLIKKSGCSIITVGAESGSQRILDFLNKGIKVEDTINFSKLCKQYGIANKFDIMVGFPGETPADLDKTLSLIKKIYKINRANEVVVFFFTPYPGTPLYDLVVEKYGFESPNSLIEWSKFDPNLIKTKWVDKKYKEKVYTFLFYLQLAYLNTHFKKKIDKSRLKLLYLVLHKLALFRLNHDFLRFPIERKIYNFLKTKNKEIIKTS